MLAGIGAFAAALKLAIAEELSSVSGNHLLNGGFPRERNLRLSYDETGSTHVCEKFARCGRYRTDYSLCIGEYGQTRSPEVKLAVKVSPA
jgi:hypothetical protein